MNPNMFSYDFKVLKERESGKCFIGRGAGYSGKDQIVFNDKLCLLMFEGNKKDAHRYYKQFCK